MSSEQSGENNNVIGKQIADEFQVNFGFGLLDKNDESELIRLQLDASGRGKGEFFSSYYSRDNLEKLVDAINMILEETEDD